VRLVINNWQYQRDKVIERARKRNPSVQIPDLLVINEKEGKLRGYSESGIDQVVRRFRDRMETLYARKFDFFNHTLRRTFGRRQWKLGTKIETISDMLGHESVEMTKRYLGLNLEDQEAR
jgi:integrase